MMITGVIIASSTRTAPAIPSVPTMKMWMACHIADVVLFKIGFCLDIAIHSTSIGTEELIDFVPKDVHWSPKYAIPITSIVSAMICVQFSLLKSNAANFRAPRGR